jgi:hypothetical protein
MVVCVFTLAEAVSGVALGGAGRALLAASIGGGGAAAEPEHLPLKVEACSQFDVCVLEPSGRAIYIFFCR